MFCAIKKFGPAQNIFGPLNGQGISYPLPGSLHILVAWFWGRIRNSSDVFTNLFQIFLGLKYLQMKTRSCSKTIFSQFANWKRIHNKYGLKKS